MELSRPVLLSYVSFPYRCSGGIIKQGWTHFNASKASYCALTKADLLFVDIEKQSWLHPWTVFAFSLIAMCVQVPTTILYFKIYILIVS